LYFAVVPSRCICASGLFRNAPPARLLRSSINEIPYCPLGELRVPGLGWRRLKGYEYTSQGDLTVLKLAASITTLDGLTSSGGFSGILKSVGGPSKQCGKERGPVTRM